MVELQRLTGMRPSEVCTVRARDIDRSADVWCYRPASHKTEHHGHDRTIYFGPKARALVEPWLRPDPDAFLFQPAEAESERRAARSAARVTPASCGNVPGSNRRRRPSIAPGDRYTPASYRRAIQRACQATFEMPSVLRRPSRDPVAEGERRTQADAWRRQFCWHPHQLRHGTATRIRREFGLEAAKVVLGHRTLTATQVYAEQDVSKAKQVMTQVG